MKTVVEMGNDFSYDCNMELRDDVPFCTSKDSSKSYLESFLARMLHDLLTFLSLVAYQVFSKEPP